jgi:hypothetical protein
VNRRGEEEGSHLPTIIAVVLIVVLLIVLGIALPRLIGRMFAA